MEEVAAGTHECPFANQMDTPEVAFHSRICIFDVITYLRQDSAIYLKNWLQIFSHRQDVVF